MKASLCLTTQLNPIPLIWEAKNFSKASRHSWRLRLCSQVLQDKGLGTRLRKGNKGTTLTMGWGWVGSWLSQFGLDFNSLTEIGNIRYFGNEYSNIRIFVTKITNNRIYSFPNITIFVFEYLIFGEKYSNIRIYSNIRSPL